MAEVFVTGGTGDLGRPLIQALREKRFDVHALVRPGSMGNVQPGVVKVIGDALDAATFAHAIPRGATFVHLVGTPHSSPAKAAEFQRVDLVSIKASVRAASESSMFRESEERRGGRSTIREVKFRRDSLCLITR